MRHSHNDFIKQFPRTLNDIEVTVRHGIETARVNSASHKRKRSTFNAQRSTLNFAETTRGGSSVSCSMLNQSAKPHFFNIDCRAHSIPLAASPLCLASPERSIHPTLQIKHVRFAESARRREINFSK